MTAIERVSQSVPIAEAKPIGLRLANVWKRFGGVVAVKDVSFTAMARSTPFWVRTGPGKPH